MRILETIMPGDDGKKIVAAIDLNADGIIDYSEFVDWVFGEGEYAKEDSGARTIVQLASNVESPQEQLDRCLQELSECEKALAITPEDIWFEAGEAAGMRFGRGDERQSNIVMRVDASGAAARAGVQPGWQVSEVLWAGKSHKVTGTTYVPDLIMEAQSLGSVHLKFLSNEVLDRQRAAEFRLPELLAALDIAQKRHANASRPLEYSKPKPLPASDASPMDETDEKPEAREDGLPADAAAALAKYSEDATAAALPPSYEELQEAMGKESWTKWRFGMGPQEWLEMMGMADVEQDDPYKVLGVDPDATQEELKIAFRERAREFHPDKFPEDPESAAKRFDCIKKAYDRVRTEDARIKADKQLGITDWFTLFSNENREGRRRMCSSLIAIKDDPEALPREAGMDDDLKRRACVVVKYYNYKLPFKVADGRLAISEVDAIYGLTDSFPNCSMMLAKWRQGDCHILRADETDSGESPILKQEGGFFCDLQAGMNYHLLVQERA